MYDIIIVGAGPAGLTAAIYAGRNGKSVLLLEKEGFGGQIAQAPLVENYPGAEAAAGEVLAERMAAQAMELEPEVEFAAVTGLDRREGCIAVRTAEGETYEGRAVILAVGARHRSLGLPGEAELLGRGLSCCAVCDGAFYAGQDVAVAGGGDSALQEALLLSGICRRVYVLHRRRAFRADEAKLRQARQKENLELVTPVEITGFLEDAEGLSGLRLRDRESGEERQLRVRALFVSVGREPELGGFANVLPLSPSGYAAVGESCEAGEGVFVAGDCREKAVRQLATAVGDGAAAALAACAYVDRLGQGT